MAEKKTTEKKLGPILARRGGDVMRLSRTEGKKRFGYIVSQDGEVSDEVNVDSVLARGYWELASGNETLKSYLKAIESGYRKQV